MTPLAALLALALAADPADPPRRAALDPSNAARAKAGLLPRKAARTRPEVRDVRGRRVITVRAPAPTYLAEPAPLAESGPLVEPAPVADDDDAVATSEATGDRDSGVPPPERVGARGPTQVRRLHDAVTPGRAGSEPEDAAADVEPAAIAPPEELGTLRAALVGVVTDVVLRIRFDP